MIRREETIRELEKPLILTERTVVSNEPSEDADNIDKDDIEEDKGCSFLKDIDGRDVFQLVKLTSDAEFSANRIVDHIFDKAFAMIQERYLIRKLPQNIINSINTTLDMTFDMEF